MASLAGAALGHATTATDWLADQLPPALARLLQLDGASPLRKRATALAVIYVSYKLGSAVFTVLSNRHHARRIRYTDGSEVPEAPGTTVVNRWLIGNVRKIFKHGSTVAFHRHNFELLNTKAYLTVDFFGQPLLTVADPKALHSILSANGYRYVKPGNISRMIHVLAGERGLLVLEGEDHKLHRRVITPLFNMGTLKKLFPMVEASCNELERILDAEAGTGKPVEFHLLSTALTLNVIGRAAFATNFDAFSAHGVTPLGKAYHDLLGQFGITRWNVAKALIPLLQYLPTPGNLYAKRARSFIFAEVERIIRGLRDGHASYDAEASASLIHALLQNQKHENGEGKLSEEDIRDEMLTFLLAGHETSSNALSMTLYYLAKFPETQEKLATALASLPKDLSVDDVLKFDPLVRVVNEGMRMHSPVAATIRNAAHDAAVPTSDGRQLFIPKDTRVIVPIQAMHMSESYFPNPDTFDPDRWLHIRVAGLEDADSKAADAKEIPATAFLPFLAGPRACIGRALAMTELKLFIARIVRNYKISLPVGREEKPKIIYSITARPKEVPLIFERRSSS